MLNLPFNKWSLKFHDPEFESQYEDHLNKIRLLSFRILNLTISIASLICLITFVIQQQTLLLSIMMTLTLMGSVFLLIISKKTLPYLKSIFSFYYVWAITINILIALAGVSIPNFIFGFNTCSLAIVIIKSINIIKSISIYIQYLLLSQLQFLFDNEIYIFNNTMQYSDNKLKIAYTITTPFVLMGIFDVYRIDTIAFVFLTISCTSFIGIWGYMNEYTSRLAFSLNLISNKQKDLINEFVNDAMFAISLDQRSRQFVLEFQNNKFVELMNIKETEQIKTFLRQTFILIKQNECQIKQRDKSSTKVLNLEEVLFQKIQSFEKSLNYKEQKEGLFEIYQQDLINNETKKMCLQIRFLNFGKPIIIAIIKSEQVPNLIHKYECQIKEYQKVIINMSNQIIKKQSNLYEEMKKIKFENQKEQQQLLQLQCVSLSIMNYIRNYILFFQKSKITEMKLSLQNCKFHNYIAIINQYFQSISAYYSIKFTLQNYIDQNSFININIKYLTQILINIFDELIKKKIQNNLINLRIVEEFQQNHNKKKQSFQEILINKQNEEQVKQFNLVQFTFFFSSNEPLNLKNLNFNKRFNNNDQNNLLEDNQIISEITCLLLDNIGPNNNISINHCQTPQMSSFQNTIQFLIYSDSSSLEPSYYKVREQILFD